MSKRDNGFDWSDSIGLKEYFEKRLEDQEKATGIAYESMEKRLAGMNEFRDTLRDQAGRFIMRSELELIVDRLETDIKNLQLAKALLEGKASQESVNAVAARAQWGLMFGAIGTIIAVIGFISRILEK